MLELSQIRPVTQTTVTRTVPVTFNELNCIFPPELFISNSTASSVGYNQASLLVSITSGFQDAARSYPCRYCKPEDREAVR